MPPTRLTDAELDALMSAAAPIAPERRDGFLREVASTLATFPEIGPGNLFQVCREVQRRYWSPPALSRAAGTSKYR